ncbi:hypothetical protein BOW16_02830 [Solemya velum gill symbiont]|uniref:4-hydroxybenzoate polyprenyltransferase-like protein n=1 Tax=Solemya velum gill symbiont TaxID=2340 RepID=A0A0B0HCW0_SOVGS|nr:4-hydroxybenzoate polyprenyltransferase-like protein [Solemya velum gill symbiont]OOY53287.1 hypothetical protein BOV97_02930 [Solemya velum gill symbiont]OOY57068.1 hypothetical protein BOV99_02235 [Solemya velum gill symbiont]OOY58254.1 hypothetical protein BOW00_02780 [Solemya velum gill symbiont]OOY61903.1 hypothetical protein BOW02_00625 [Solemya velum gill symbiont]
MHLNWLSRKLHEILFILRFHDWQSKTAFFLVAIGYSMSQHSVPIADNLMAASSLFLLLCLYAASGYSLNQYFDRGVDKACGKHRDIGDFPIATARITIIVLLVIAFLFSLHFLFSGKFYVWILYWASIAAALAYSMPPLRLKERGYFGWISASLAQRVLPFVVIFEYFDVWTWISAGLCLLALMTGLRYIIVHQLEDYAADLKVGVETVATRIGPQQLRQFLFRYIVPLEIIYLVTLAIYMSLDNGVLLGGFTLFGLTLVAAFSNKRAGHETPELDLEKYEFLWGLYCIYWPVAMGFSLLMNDIAYFPFLIFVLLWASRWIKHDLQRLMRGFLLMTQQLKGE